MCGGNCIPISTALKCLKLNFWVREHIFFLLICCSKNNAKLSDTKCLKKVGLLTSNNLDMKVEHVAVAEINFVTVKGFCFLSLTR